MRCQRVQYNQFNNYLEGQNEEALKQIMRQQQNRVIKAYQQEIKLLKQKNRYLEQEINERVRNYLIQHRNLSSPGNTFQRTCMSLRTVPKATKTSNHFYTAREHQQPNFTKNLLQECQISVQNSGNGYNKRVNKRIQRLLSIKICPNKQNEIIFKDLESQYLATQEDSLIIDECISQGLLTKESQKDKEICILTTKVQQLQQRLQKSEDELRVLKKQFQLKQSQHQNSNHSMKNIIDQLQASLKIQITKESENNAKTTLQQQNMELRKKLQIYKDFQSQNSQLRKVIESYKKKLEKQYILKQQFLKSYSKLKTEKQQLQVILKEQKKIQSYQTYEPIIQSELQQRPSSTISNSTLEQNIVTTQKAKEEIQKILQIFDQILSQKRQFDYLFFMQMFEKLKNLYENTWNTNFPVSIDLRKKKQQIVDRQQNIINNLHRDYQNVISRLIRKNQLWQKKVQQQFGYVLTKMIKISNEQISLITNKMTHQTVRYLPQKLEQVKQEKPLFQYASSLLNKNLSLPTCNLNNPFKQNKQQQQTRIQQLQTKIRQLNIYKEQAQVLRAMLKKTGIEFKQFMMKTIEDNKIANRKIGQKSLKQLNDQAFVKVLGKRIYNLVQIIPQAQQQSPLFEPQNNSEILSFLNMIETFFSQYQESETQQKKQKQMYQQIFFNVMTKLINMYDIAQEQILQELKQSNGLIQLQNQLHHYYRSKSKQKSQNQIQMGNESDMTFGKQTDSDLQFE